MSFNEHYTIRLVALFAMIAVCTYSCAGYHAESDKNEAAMMKACMDAGHIWKERWMSVRHYCE